MAQSARDPIQQPQVPPLQAEQPRPRATSEPLVTAKDFAEVESMVANGINSARIVVLQDQDEAAAIASAEAHAAEGRGPVPTRAHQAPWRTLVVIPTYNEKGNVESIVQAVHSYLDCDVLIVDDGSPDGTGEIADRMAAADSRIHVLHRQGKQGLGTAYLAGFATRRGTYRVSSTPPMRRNSLSAVATSRAAARLAGASAAACCHAPPISTPA